MSVTDKETCTVTIFGTEYRVSGAASPEHIAEIAAYVDTIMRDLHSKLQVPSSTRLAILAALHIADELLRERGERDAVLTRVQEKADVLRLLIDAAPGDEGTQALPDPA